MRITISIFFTDFPRKSSHLQWNEIRKIVVRESESPSWVKWTLVNQVRTSLFVLRVKILCTQRQSEFKGMWTKTIIILFSEKMRWVGGRTQENIHWFRTLSLFQFPLIFKALHQGMPLRASANLWAEIRFKQFQYCTLCSLHNWHKNMKIEINLPYDKI